MLQQLDPQLKQVLQPVLNVLSMSTPKAGFAGADINPLIAIGTLGFGLKLDTSTYWPSTTPKPTPLTKWTRRTCSLAPRRLR